MGFRSYVRHFWGAILKLLRPSLPWCFPIRRLSFEQAVAAAAVDMPKCLSSKIAKTPLRLIKNLYIVNPHIHQVVLIVYVHFNLDMCNSAV